MLKGMMLGLSASTLLMICDAGGFARSTVAARPATKKVHAVASQEGQTRSAPDNSIVTVVVRNGARIETRVFNNPNSRISRIVRTTARDGKRTTRIYYRDGRVRQLKEGDDDNVLEETADAIASFADSAVDVTATVARETAETATAVASTTSDVAKDVASTTADVATDVAATTKQGAAATVERAREVASGVARTTERATETAAEATVETATAVGSTTVEAAEETGNFFVRGIKAIGRGFKRVFGF